MKAKKWRKKKNQVEELLHSQGKKFIHFSNVLESSENNFCICNEIFKKFSVRKSCCRMQAKEISTRTLLLPWKIMFYDSSITGK